MNKELLETLKIHPTKVRYRGNAQILEEEEKKYVMKKISPASRDIYHYLESRNFLHFPRSLFISSDNIEISEYIPDAPVDAAQRVEDMIYLLTLLHNKTTFYKELDLDEIKKIYEEGMEEFQYLLKYYQSIEQMIQEEVYMSPANYYFILNITRVYQILNQGILSLEKWYQLVQNKKTLRFVLNHNHLKKEHLREGENLCFISWNKANFGFPQNDLLNLWQNNYEYLSLSSLLDLYQSKYRLLEYEYYHFVAKICRLKRIDFNKKEQEKMREIIYFIKYMEKVDDYLSKQDTNKPHNQAYQ